MCEGKTMLSIPHAQLLHHPRKSLVVLEEFGHVAELEVACLLELEEAFNRGSDDVVVVCGRLGLAV